MCSCLFFFLSFCFSSKLNAGGGGGSGDQGTQLTEMMAEISALKETMETWKELFRQELGLGEGVESEDEVNLEQLKEKLVAMKKDRSALTSSILGYHSSLDALRKEVKHLRHLSDTSPSSQNISTTLIDPGLARQFRHMESEVEQGREMMKVRSDPICLSLSLSICPSVRFSFCFLLLFTS